MGLFSLFSTGDVKVFADELAEGLARIRVSQKPRKNDLSL